CSAALPAARRALDPAPHRGLECVQGAPPELRGPPAAGGGLHPAALDPVPAAGRDDAAGLPRGAPDPYLRPRPKEEDVLLAPGIRRILDRGDVILPFRAPEVEHFHRLRGAALAHRLVALLDLERHDLRRDPVLASRLVPDLGDQV